MGSGSRHRRREEALKAGLPDPGASADAGDAATQERRAHKVRQRLRRTEERHAGVEAILSKLTMPPADELGAFARVEDAPAWRGGNPAPVDWSNMDVSCDPATMAHDGNEAAMRGDTVGDSNPGTDYKIRYSDSKSTADSTLPPMMSLRARRKRWQVESFALVLRELSLTQTQSDPPLTVVDFGAGSGALVLPLAFCFPKMRFVAVEMKQRSCDLLMRRAAAAKLKNVTPRVTMIENFHDPFDVGVALHACGNATDHVLVKSVLNKAHFAVSPCCIGKLKFSVKGGNSFGEEGKDWTRGRGDVDRNVENAQKPDDIQNKDISKERGINPAGSVLCVQITHPRSSWMSKQLPDSNDFSLLACAADTGHAGEGDSAERIVQIGRRAKVHVELDRAQAAREQGYEVVAVSIIEGANSPPNKNHMLIGAPGNNAAWLEGLRPVTNNEL